MDPLVTSALISGGTRLLGGLFGKKSSTQTSRVDYKQMVKDAEAAGFNPTAVLRNGGAAGYTNTTLPSLTTGEILADALSTGVGTYYAGKSSEIDRELEQVELEIAREELAQIQKQGNLDTSQYFGYGIPQAHNTSGIEYDDGSLAQVAVRSDGRPWNSLDSGALRAAISDTTTGPTRINENVAPQTTAFGVNLHGSGAFSSGQTHEDAGGEPLSWLMSPLTAFDMVYNTAASSAWEHGAAQGAYNSERGRVLQDAWSKRRSEPSPPPFQHVPELPGWSWPGGSQ